MISNKPNSAQKLSLSIASPTSHTCQLLTIQPIVTISRIKGLQVMHSHWMSVRGWSSSTRRRSLYLAWRNWHVMRMLLMGLAAWQPLLMPLLCLVLP